MPRCAAGNHFATEEGERDCSACKENIKRSKDDAPRVREQMEGLALTLKTAPVGEGDNIDKVFKKLKKGKKNKGGKKSNVESVGNDAPLTVNEAVAWYELIDEGEKFECPASARQKHETLFTREQGEALTQAFSSVKISSFKELEELQESFKDVQCSCKAYPSHFVTKNIIEKGGLNENVINETLTALEGYDLRFPYPLENHGRKDKGLKLLLTYLEESKKDSSVAQISPETLNRIYELVRLKTDPETGKVLYNERQKRNPIDGRPTEDEGWAIMQEVLSHPNCPQETLQKSVEDYKHFMKNRKKLGIYYPEGYNWEAFKGSTIVPRALSSNPNAQEQVKQLRKAVRRVTIRSTIRHAALVVSGLIQTVATLGFILNSRSSPWYQEGFLKSEARMRWGLRTLSYLRGKKKKKAIGR